MSVCLMLTQRAAPYVNSAGNFTSVALCLAQAFFWGGRETTLRDGEHCAIAAGLQGYLCQSANVMVVHLCLRNSDYRAVFLPLFSTGIMLIISLSFSSPCLFELPFFFCPPSHPPSFFFSPALPPLYSLHGWMWTLQRHVSFSSRRKQTRGLLIVERWWYFGFHLLSNYVYTDFSSSQ